MSISGFVGNYFFQNSFFFLSRDFKEISSAIKEMFLNDDKKYLVLNVYSIIVVDMNQ